MTSRTTEQSEANIPANLKAAREAAGFKQRELAALLEIGEMQVSRWERGIVLPNHANLIRLAWALKRDPGWFYVDHSKAAA